MNNPAVIEHELSQGLKGKQALWLHHFLDESNHSTFLNQTGAARAAQYNCKKDHGFTSIGAQNYRKLQDRINSWFDEFGLSETRLKEKLKNLLEAKETKFQKMKGHINDTDLVPGTRKLAETHIMGWVGKGDDAQAFDDGETLVAVEVEAIGLQKQALELAFRIKGLTKGDNGAGVGDTNILIINYGDKRIEEYNPAT